MALQNLVGSGIWLPPLPYGWYLGSGQIAASDTALLDADQEEFQLIGHVTIDGGGSKTFGTSGSKVSWLPGASITFAASSTLTVGVKTAVDAANGPAARATIGAAAFAVSKALVGGTDTITSTTWRDDSMASGTPFTVTDGDLIAICWHLATSGGTPSIKVRQNSVSTTLGLPCPTLVTSGPTYTVLTVVGNCILTFDDGTIGWIDPVLPFSAADINSANINNGNIFGNIFRVPFPCKVDAIAGFVDMTTNAADAAFQIYTTPLGTPVAAVTLAIDANIYAAFSAAKIAVKRLLTPYTLAANTDYCVGVKQTTATLVITSQRDQSDANFFKPLGMGSECYAATSTAGATFVSSNSGKRRFNISVRVSALDDGVSGGGSVLMGAIWT